MACHSAGTPISLSLSHSLDVWLCLTACIYGRYGNGGYYTPGEAESLRAHNDRMDWLWQAVDFFAPELYLDLSSAHTHSPTHPENGTLKLCLCSSVSQRNRRTLLRNTFVGS